MVSSLEKYVVSLGTTLHDHTLASVQNVPDGSQLIPELQIVQPVTDFKD